MKTYMIIYTTNKVNRFEEEVSALDYTKAFLDFTCRHSKETMIVDMWEVENEIC